MNKALKITLTIILFAIVFIAIIIGVKFAIVKIISPIILIINKISKIAAILF